MSRQPTPFEVAIERFNGGYGYSDGPNWSDEHERNGFLSEFARATIEAYQFEVAEFIRAKLATWPTKRPEDRELTPAEAVGLARKLAEDELEAAADA